MYIMHTVVETHEFRTQAKKLLTDDEIALLVTLIARDPKAGDLIASTGGFRKLRLARPGAGKSGGYRVVYFYYDEGFPVLLTTIYAKNDRENLTQSQRNALAAIAASIKQAIRSGT